MGHVVAYGIPEYVVEGLGFRHITALLADHDDKLAFVVEPRRLLCHLVHGNGVCRPGQRGDGLVLFRLLASA